MRPVDPLTARQQGVRAPLDARIAQIAGRQGGVVSRAQLRGLGLSVGGIDARVARGALHVVHRGVYAVGHPVLRGVGLEHAALLACPAGTPRSHRSAAAGWHLRGWASRTVEVTIPGWGKTRPGILVHRHRLHPDDVTVLDGLAITTVARTIFDLAETLTRDRHRRVWEEAERLRLLDVAAVRAVAGRNPGRHALKVILPLLLTRGVAGTSETRSPLEVDFLAFHVAWLARFPLPLVNSTVHGFEIDAYYPWARLAVELDSRLHHDNDPAFERDRAKWNVLTACGETVFPLTARRLRAEPALVAEQLAGLLACRAPC